MTGTHEGRVHEVWWRPFVGYVSLPGACMEMVDCEPLGC